MDRGTRLKQALKEHPLVSSGAALARAAKLNPVTVRAYLTSEREPPLDAAMAMGKVLGVNGQWIFDGKGSKTLAKPAANEPARVTEVPLLDHVVAGRLTAPDSQIPMWELPLLEFANLGPGDFFALRVSGTSMDRLSPDGSIVVVNRRDQALISGKCYIFSVKGEVTYKRWQGGDPAYLDPFSTDASHRPIFIRRKQDLDVIGRVVKTVLDL